MKASGFLYPPAVIGHRPFQGGGGRLRRGEQRLDKLPRLGMIELDLLVFSHNLAGHFQRVKGDEFGQRAALNSRRPLEKLLVRRGHPGDEAFAFRFF